MSLAKLFVEVGADVNNFERGMKNVRSEMDRTAKQASFFSNTLSTAVGTGVSMAVGKAVSSLTGFIEYIKKTGEEFNALKENSQLAFETMLGSGEKATKFLKDLQKFAEVTPFELPGLIDASQKMLAFGFTAQSVIPTLTSIGDAVAGLGGSPEKLQRVITAIGQIKAKGKIQAQEMLQLAEAGIPAWEMLAKAIGKSIPEAMKESEKGAIDASTAINALITGMNAKFGGLMAKQAKSFTGLKSTFNDLLRDVAARVTKPWFDNAKKGLERMVAIMQSDKFQQFVTKATAVSEKAANLVANVKHNIIDFIGHGFNFFHSFFGSSNDAQKSFSLIDLLPKKVRGLIAYIKPVGDFIYNIADKGFRAFTGIFDDFYRSFNKISNQRFYFFGDMSLEQFSTGIKSIFNDIRSGGKNLNYWLYTAPKVFQVITRLMLSAKNIFTYFSGDGLQSTLKRLGSILTGLGSILAKLVRPFKEALGSLFNQLSTMKNLGFADIFKTVLTSIGAAFMGFLKVIQQEFWPTIKSALVWVWNSLTSFVSSIDWGSLWSSVTGVFFGLIDFVKNIDWGAVGTAVTNLLDSIVGFVSSIDWSSVWSTVWSGLTAVGSYISENVFPIFTGFFSWLVSWFTDSSKRDTLINAITSTWTFITDWASYLWSAVSPYLSNFFGWLLSWFTDSNKRGQLWNGILATWNFVASWANSLVTWITPYLSKFWSWLSSWFTDPNKRKELWDGLVSTWNALQLWGANLWGWLYPNMVSMWVNLKSWIDTNRPQFGSWIDEFSNTTTKIKNDWIEKWPLVTQSFMSLANTVKTEVPLIVTALDSLFKTIAGDGSTWTSLGDYFSDVAIFYSRYFEFIIKMTRVTIELLNEMAATTKAAFSFDWEGYVSGSQRFGDKITELGGLFSSFKEIYSGYATGGIVNEGKVLVGEKGSELVDLPKGSRVWDHGQSMGKLQQQVNQPMISNNTNQATTNNNTSNQSIYNTKNLNNTSQAYNNYNNTANNQTFDNSQTISKTQSLVNNLSKTISSITNRSLSNLFNSSNTINKSTAFSDTNTLTKNNPLSVANTYNTATSYVPPSPSQKIEIVIRNEGSTPTDRKTIDEIAMQLQRRLNLQGNRFVLA